MSEFAVPDSTYMAEKWKIASEAEAVQCRCLISTVIFDKKGTSYKWDLPEEDNPGRARHSKAN